MNLPVRKYYSLNDAAKYLSCEISDLIHFGATERLSFYAYINHKNNSDKFHFQINMPDYAVDKIDFFGSIMFDDWVVLGVEYNDQTDILPVNGYYAKEVRGLFFVEHQTLIDMEFSSNNNAIITFFSDVNYLENEFPIEFNVLGFEICVSPDALCIKHEDLEKLKELNSPHADESDKTLAKKENLIRALLELIPELSGVDVDTISVKKLKEIIETTAAERGVDFPRTDLGTWSKYLERGRHKK